MNSLGLRIYTCSLLGALLLAGCRAQDDDPPQATGLTYWGDVAPIFMEKCVRCHREGGLAPFALDQYGSAKVFAMAAAKAVRDETMPPYRMIHDGTCGEFEDDETLTPEQIDQIWNWAHSGAAEGTPKTLSQPPEIHLQGAKEWKTPEIVPLPLGGPRGEEDEYRCFALDSSLHLDKEAFITGFEVLPGTPALVHHVMVFLIDPAKVTRSGKTNAEMIDMNDQKDPDRVGWTCWGGAGEGVEVENFPAVWVPGHVALSYPGGVGIRHRPGQTIVAQMHYNFADARIRGMSDSTAIRFKHADSVEREAITIAEDGFLDTLKWPPVATLEPGQPSVSFSWTKNGSKMKLDRYPYVDLVAVHPHMHTRGVRWLLEVGPPGGPMSCAGKMDRYDWHWQRFYFYEGTPFRITPTTELKLTCGYDTSRETQPIQPGWATDNEMCVSLMMLALPPGVPAAR